MALIDNLIAYWKLEEAPTSSAGTGTIAQTGTSVAGIGTLFTTEAAVGNLITGTGGILGIVVSITNDIALTLSSTATVAAGQAYTIGKGVSRADSFASETLSDNRTVGQAVGKIGNAAQFTRTFSQFLSRADDAALSTGDIDFSFSAWVWIDSSDGINNYTIVSKRNSVTVREHSLQYNSVTPGFDFIIYDSGGTARGTVAAGASPTLSAWHFVVAYHDSVNNLVGLSVDGATYVTAATTGAPSDTLAVFRMGAVNTTPTNFWDGRVDEVGFWKRVLTQAEVTVLYNGGNGLAYPFGYGQLLSDKRNLLVMA